MIEKNVKFRWNRVLKTENQFVMGIKNGLTDFWSRRKVQLIKFGGNRHRCVSTCLLYFVSYEPSTRITLEVSNYYFHMLFQLKPGLPV